MARDYQQYGICYQQRLRPACAYAQTDQSLCWLLKYSMTIKLLTEPHLRFLSLKGCCIGSSESTLVKIPHCWKSHVTTQLSKFALCKLSVFYPIPADWFECYLVGNPFSRNTAQFIVVIFRNVYKDVKFLDIPTIKDVWKWRNGPELKEILEAPFDQKVTNF